MSQGQIIVNILSFLSHHQSPPPGTDAEGPNVNISYIFHKTHEERGRVQAHSFFLYHSRMMGKFKNKKTPGVL